MKIKHHLIRETLKELKIKQNIHIDHFLQFLQDGFGISSSFVVGLITVLLKLLNQNDKKPNFKKLIK